MAKNKKKNKKDKQIKPESVESQVAALTGETAEVEALEGPPPKMSRKEFEKEMEKLQVELVKLQEWVKASGAKICVLFEGRNTAGICWQLE